MTGVTEPSRVALGAAGRLAGLMDADRRAPESAPPEGTRDPADAAPGDLGSLAGLGEELPESGPPTPAVVAVVVAHGGAPNLEATLESLVAAEYPDLTVLVLAATDDDLRVRVASVAPGAFVKPVEGRGHAAAANEARSTVTGAPFLLFCHDDVVLVPGTVRVLVEEAYRSNAAVVGPKLVDVDRPEILREVGWSVDRFGVPHSEIQADELDQEQHDAVRDVFFVSDACVLVRADLFAALDGFDVDCDPGARMLDFCWRARLAGARVMVAPDARVGHHRLDPYDESDAGVVHRDRIRAVLTDTGALRLLWIAPVAFLMHAVEALALAVRGQRSRARQLMAAWWWNVTRSGSLRAARARAQSARRVPDAEIRAVQYHGSARVAAYVTRSLHAPDRVRSLSERSRRMADSANTQLRSVRGIAVIAVLALLLIGMRDLVLGRVAAVGELAVWPGLGDLLRAFTSEWRYAGLGAHSPAAPLTIVAAVLRVLALGAGGLPRTVLVVGAIPVGMFGAARLTRAATGRGWPAASAAVVYGVLPLPRNAIELGDLGPLLLYAAAPWLTLVVLQLADLVPRGWPRRRLGLLAVLTLAVVVLFWVPSVLFGAVVVAGFALAAPLTGDDRRTFARLTRTTALLSGLALVVLVPWPLAVVAGGDRLGLLGVVERAPDSFGALLRFQTGANGSGIGGWAYVALGLTVVFLVRGEAERWCWRWWGVALGSWMLAALPTWLGTATPATNGVLVPAALAVSQLAGLGVAAVLGEVRSRGLGWSQVAAVLAGTLLAFAVLGFVGDTAGGRFHQPSDDWSSALEWMTAQRDRGPFRVLWIGRPEAVPGAIHRSGPDAYAITLDGPGDLRDLLPPPGGHAMSLLDDAVRALRQRTTTRVGRMIAPMAVRYVVVPDRAAPDAPRVGPPSSRGALRDQLDLAALEASPGIAIYENRAWVPGDARLGDAPTAPVGIDGAAAITAVDPGAPGVQLWSEQYDAAWRGRSPGAQLRHRRVFGWANGFPVPRGGRATVTFANQWWRWPTLLLEAVIVAAVVRGGLRRRRRARRAAEGADRSDAGSTP